MRASLHNLSQSTGAPLQTHLNELVHAGDLQLVRKHVIAALLRRGLQLRHELEHALAIGHGCPREVDGAADGARTREGEELGVRGGEWGGVSEPEALQEVM